ncbi:MAG: DUF4358 domain-containing protein [Ruminococcaceae bacterium]|nr:DUF4358 domain-containing protein [Oscillospiraceae bacterium]
MKKLIIFLSLIAIASILTACGKDGYSDSVLCRDILESSKEKAPVDMGYGSFDDDYKKAYFDSTLFEDCDIRYSLLAEDINEFGVFRAKDKKNAKSLYGNVRDYLSELKTDKRAFIESYAPEQIPKLDNAEVRRYGNYVVYAILPDGERTEFFGAIEALLKK